MNKTELTLTEQIRLFLNQVWVRRGLSLLAGVACALILHYALYRVELPSKPFIYVAF